MARKIPYHLMTALVIASWLSGLLVPQDAAADSLGFLEGTVISLGYCDAAPAPLEGAEVSIITSEGATASQTTDPSGSYSFGIEVSTSTLVTATVTALNYESGFVADIVVTEDGTSVVDFELRWLVPCTTVEPESLEVTLEAGLTTSRALTLTNTGAAVTSFAIQETAGGYTTTLPLPVTRSGEAVIIEGASWGISSLAANQTSATPSPRPENELIVTQSLSQAILSGNSVACNLDLEHTDSSYLRTFELADYGIDYDFLVSRVEIGIEKAEGDGGDQPAELNLYSLEGELLWENLTLLETKSLSIADSSLVIIDIPITTLIPAGTTLVVEFYTPSGLDKGNSIFIGSNNLGQTGPTYLAAPACGIGQPVSTDKIGFPDMHLVMNVYGDISLVDPGEVAWLKETPITGMLGSECTSNIEVLFTPAYTLTAGTYTSTLQIATDDPENNPLQVPITMTIVEYGLALSTAIDSLTGDPGSVVSYTITLTNTSQGVADFFDLSVLDAAYITTLIPDTTPLLNPGEGFTFQVDVKVGWISDQILSDPAIILASFHGNPLHQERIVLTTTIRTKDVFLPLLSKKSP